MQVDKGRQTEDRIIASRILHAPVDLIHSNARSLFVHLAVLEYISDSHPLHTFRFNAVLFSFHSTIYSQRWRDRVQSSSSHVDTIQSRLCPFHTPQLLASRRQHLTYKVQEFHWFQHRECDTILAS